MKILPFLLFGFVACSCAFADGPSPAAESKEATTEQETTLTPQQQEAMRLAQSLKLQKGVILLPGGKAKLTLPESQAYLSPDDAATVLTRLWGNPEGEKPLGMIVPEGWSPFSEEEWAAVISYSDDGHVHDTDAAKINYGDLLKSMQEGIRESNTERQKAGYPSIELVGWATQPHYDPSAHKLYWAKNLKFGDSNENTLNYNIRVLGRSGFLEINVVGRLQDLKQIEQATPAILSSVDFVEGSRYADFKEGTDKVATYGIAALIAGGVAAKAGFFKVLWLTLLAAKKFVVLGVVALAGFIKKLFNRKKESAALRQP